MGSGKGSQKRVNSSNQQTNPIKTVNLTNWINYLEKEGTINNDINKYYFNNSLKESYMNNAEIRFLLIELFRDGVESSAISLDFDVKNLDIVVADTDHPSRKKINIFNGDVHEGNTFMAIAALSRKTKIVEGRYYLTQVLKAF